MHWMITADGMYLSLGSEEESLVSLYVEAVIAIEAVRHELNKSMQANVSVAFSKLAWVRPEMQVNAGE